MKISVVCGFIICKKKILVAKNRANHTYPNKWEFPGGKVEPNEELFEAIKREIMEELSLEVSPLLILKSIEVDGRNSTFELIPIVCHTNSTHFKLHQHAQAEWVTKEELYTIDFAASDRELLEVNWGEIIELF